MENQVQALLSDCALAVLVSIGFRFTYFSPLPSSSPALWAPNLPCPGTEGLGALHLGAPPNHYMDQPRAHWARHPQRAVILSSWPGSQRVTDPVPGWPAGVHWSVLWLIRPAPALPPSRRPHSSPSSRAQLSLPMRPARHPVLELSSSSRRVKKRRLLTPQRHLVLRDSFKAQILDFNNLQH